jgi:hypothetical protein
LPAPVVQEAPSTGGDGLPRDPVLVDRQSRLADLLGVN